MYGINVAHEHIYASTKTDPSIGLMTIPVGMNDDDVLYINVVFIHLTVGLVTKMPSLSVQYTFLKNTKLYILHSQSIKSILLSVLQ